MEQSNKQTNVTNDVFNTEYMPYVVRYGKLINWLFIIASFGPAMVLLVIHGELPPINAIITGFISIAAAVGVVWFVEPVSFFPVIGVAGTYMAFLTGNISNVRIPAAVSAQKVAEVEPGTDEGTIIATIGMGVSVLINLVFVALGAFGGAAILEILPDPIMDSLQFLLPALFGALFIQFATRNLKLAPFGLGIAIGIALLVQTGIFSFLPGNGGFLTTLGAVFGSIAIGQVMSRQKSE